MGELPPRDARPADHSAWRTLLHELAASLEELVDDFLDRLAAQHLYAEHLVPPDELRIAARETLGMLIRLLSGVEIDPADAQRAHQLGARRARQGVDRDSLLEAVRLDYRVLWAGLRRLAGEQRAALLVEHADEVLTTVERYIGDVQVAFLNEQDAMARSSRHDQQRAFARLMSTPADDLAKVAEAVAPAIRLRADATLEVLCLVAPDAIDAIRLASVRRRTVEWDFADGTVFVREQAKQGWAELSAPPPGGLVTAVRGLAALPQAVRLSQLLAPIARARGSVVREHDAWPAIAAASLERVLPSLSPAAYPAFFDLTAVERRRLLATVRQYLTTGSVKATAETLFLHRNTVQNHLVAFAAVTALDVTVPEQAARALISFAREDAGAVRVPAG